MKKKNQQIVGLNLTEVTKADKNRTILFQW